jgi:hypothetical protein
VRPFAAVLRLARSLTPFLDLFRIHGPGRIAFIGASLVISSFATPGCKPGTAPKDDAPADSMESEPEDSQDVRGPRTALLIANGNYKSLTELNASRRDAERVAAAFRRIGVKLYGGKPLLDLTADQMDRALNAYAQSVDRGGEAYLYYRGRGAQMEGADYLLPVDFAAADLETMKRESIALDDILAILEKTPSRLRVVILDANRDERASTRKSARTNILRGPNVSASETLVCFSTMHGAPSFADEKASSYSESLAEEMLRPGKIENVMKIVRRRVADTTENKQVPFTYGNLSEDYFFTAPPSHSSGADGISSRARQRSGAKGQSDAGGPSVSAENSPQTATRGEPFVNSLGMKFVPAATPGVLFSVWDTRVQDYAAFAQEKGIKLRKPNFDQGPTHPVVNVSWDDAHAFCDWLTEKDRAAGLLAAGQMYRLPKDGEWSLAVGLAEETGDTPADRAQRGPNLFAWGPKWPPPPGAANLADESGRMAVADPAYIPGYDDSYTYTSPVQTFTPNRYGLYDMSGNVWQWCEELYNGRGNVRVLRGGSWESSTMFYVRCSGRYGLFASAREDYAGFRCVLAAPEKPSIAPPPH